MPLFERCLQAVLAQCTPWPFEVIVIDSDSSDGTWELLRSLPVKRIRIRREEFNHGATRNLGAIKARGEFLVFLVQDAVPRDENWLATLIAVVARQNLAASYGRQMARPGSHALTRRSIERFYPDSQQRVIKQLPDGKTGMSLMHRFQLALFTNTCSCLRKEVWAEHPFAEIPYGEDMEWAKRILEAGYAIAYEPAAAVYHSHERSAWYEFKRAYADHVLVYRLFGLTVIPSLRTAIRTIAWGVNDSWRYVLASHDHLLMKVRLFFWTPFLVTFQVFGEYLGARADQFQRDYPWFQRLDSIFRRSV